MTERNDYIYARLSDIIYRNPDIENSAYKELPKGIEFIAASGSRDNEEGYFGAAFKYGNEIIIVHRGTNNPLDSSSEDGLFMRFKEFAKDLEDDLKIANGKSIPQYSHALEFTKSIQQKFGNDVSITQTGHSLGGALAQLLSLDIKTPCVSFDAPGVKKVAITMFGKEIVDAHKITSYTSAPNIINTVGEPIAFPNQLGIELPKVEGIKFYDYIKFTLYQHNMSLIVQQFNPETGIPIMTAFNNLWPTYSNGYELFTKIFDHENTYKNDVIKLESKILLSESVLEKYNCYFKLSNKEHSGGTEISNEKYLEFIDSLDLTDSNQQGLSLVILASLLSDEDSEQNSIPVKYITDDLKKIIDSFKDFLISKTETSDIRCEDDPILKPEVIAKSIRESYFAIKEECKLLRNKCLYSDIQCYQTVEDKLTLMILDREEQILYPLIKEFSQLCDQFIDINYKSKCNEDLSAIKSLKQYLDDYISPYSYSERKGNKLIEFSRELYSSLGDECFELEANNLHRMSAEIYYKLAKNGYQHVADAYLRVTHFHDDNGVHNSDLLFSKSYHKIAGYLHELNQLGTIHSSHDEL